MIGARVIALGIGYLFGLFQTGYLYGKSQGIDIRSEGSGNAGTTNSLRVLGIKAGLITFAGDLCKAILAVLLVKVLFRNAYPDAVKILELYAGFGAVLGHNFPFYLKFKGGKGIACTSGMILAVCPLAAPVCLILFIGSIAITRYARINSGGDELSGAGTDLRTYGISAYRCRVPSGVLCGERLLYGDGAVASQKQHRTSAARHGE